MIAAMVMVYAAYVTVGLGVVFALARLAQLGGATVAANQLGAQVGKLARAGNLERALKLCDAMPKAISCMTMRAGIAEMIRTKSATHAAAAFDAARTDATAMLGSGRKLALGGIALAVSGAGLAASELQSGAPMLPALGVAAAAVLLGLWAMSKERALIVDTLLAWQHDVLPALREVETPS